MTDRESLVVGVAVKRLTLHVVDAPKHPAQVDGRSGNVMSVFIDSGEKAVGVYATERAFIAGIAGLELVERILKVFGDVFKGFRFEAVLVPLRECFGQSKVARTWS